MKIVKLIVIFLCATPYYYSIGQVTETEKTLKTQSVDTTKGWKKGGLIGINFGQTSLTNWAAGGQNSVAANGILSLFASYKKDKNAWDNSLDIGYGFLTQEGVKYTKKTDDKIDLLSKYGREAVKNFYYAALINFKTQMDVGYNYPTDSTRLKISNKFAPAYVVIALGIDYKPNAYLSIFAAPLTGKLTIVNDQNLADVGAFGVDKGKNTKSEFGSYVRMIYSKNDFKGDFLKYVAFTTKVDLFSNYTKDPQNIVVNWETLIALKINKYISVNLSTQLIYDDKIKIADKNNVAKPRVQFKEILGVGFSYKF